MSTVRSGPRPVFARNDPLDIFGKTTPAYAAYRECRARRHLDAPARRSRRPLLQGNPSQSEHSLVCSPVVSPFTYSGSGSLQPESSHTTAIFFDFSHNLICSLLDLRQAPHRRGDIPVMKVLSSEARIRLRCDFSAIQRRRPIPSVSSRSPGDHGDRLFRRNGGIGATNAIRRQIRGR